MKKQCFYNLKIEYGKIWFFLKSGIVESKNTQYTKYIIEIDKVVKVLL